MINCKGLLLFFCWSILLVGPGCKNQEGEDKRLHNTWKDDLGVGQIVLKENKEALYFGMKGTFEVQKHGRFRAFKGEEGILTLNLPSGTHEWSYNFNDKEKELSLRSKDDYKQLFLKSKETSQQIGLPTDWLFMDIEEERYPFVSTMYFTHQREFILKNHPIGFGQNASFREKIFYREKGGNWKKFQYADVNWEKNDEQEVFAAKDETVVIVKNAKKTYLSLDEGKTVKLISNKISTINGYNQLGNFKIRIVGKDLFAFIMPTNYLSVEIFKMKNFESEDRSEWIEAMSLKGVDQGTPVKVVIKDNVIYLCFHNIFRSSDFGESWEEISKGLPKKTLTGNLHLFGHDILYHDVDQKNLYVFNKDEKRWVLQDSGRFSAIFSSHETGLYGWNDGQLFRVRKYGGDKENIGSPLKNNSFKYGKIFVGHDLIFHSLRAFISRSIP